jgi:serine/threonine protein kinase
MNTPGYSSPEQVAGAKPAITSDIYSLGALLCRLLTGHSLESAGAFCSSREERRISWSREFERDWTDSSSLFRQAGLKIVTRATHHEARDRFGSAGDLAEAVSELEETGSWAPSRSHYGNKVN